MHGHTSQRTVNHDKRHQYRQVLPTRMHPSKNGSNQTQAAQQKLVKAFNNNKKKNRNISKQIKTVVTVVLWSFSKTHTYTHTTTIQSYHCRALKNLGSTPHVTCGGLHQEKFTAQVHITDIAARSSWKRMPFLSRNRSHGLRCYNVTNAKHSKARRKANPNQSDQMDNGHDWSCVKWAGVHTSLCSFSKCYAQWQCHV